MERRKAVQGNEVTQEEELGFGTLVGERRGNLARKEERKGVEIHK